MIRAQRCSASDVAEAKAEALVFILVVDVHANVSVFHAAAQQLTHALRMMQRLKEDKREDAQEESQHKVVQLYPHVEDFAQH